MGARCEPCSRSLEDRKPAGRLLMTAQDPLIEETGLPVGCLIQMHEPQGITPHALQWQPRRRAYDLVLGNRRVCAHDQPPGLLSPATAVSTSASSPAASRPGCASRTDP